MSSLYESRKFRNTLAAGLGIVLAILTIIPQQARAQTVPTRITLDQAIELAMKHNHSLLALRTTILQNKAQEVTANLRPNPTANGDWQFIPIFNPSQFNSTYLDNSAQFDLGIGYLFERGKKRQHRLAAAKDATSVTSAQVDDAERTLTFNIGQQFVAALLAQSTIELAEEDIKSFQQTVDIGQSQYKAGAISEGDFLKIKIAVAAVPERRSHGKTRQSAGARGAARFSGF